MHPVAQKILVVGGNGFVGSAVCRTAVARGMKVVSISPSGKPWQTPKGHTPGWVHKVEWHKGSALEPETYADLLAETVAVVHTVGTLFEKRGRGYKGALRDGNVAGLVGSAVGAVGEARGSGNPLKRESREGSYEVVNRDTALRVCEAFLQSAPPAHTNPDASTPRRAFIYLSAEDCARPVVPAGYIESKRAAERGIARMVQDAHPAFRAVFLRPTLIYHPHLRPLVSPAAALLDLSATLHAKAPAGFPTPAGLLRALGALLPRARSGDEEGLDTALDAMARVLTLPPIHVDHVAEAACIAADVGRMDVSGVYGLEGMRELIGWRDKGRRA